MKKILFPLLALVMILGITATGCGKKEDLVMATNASFPPYEYYEGNKIVGIDAEIAAAIAKKLNMNLVIEDTEFGSIIAGARMVILRWEHDHS